MSKERKLSKAEARRKQAFEVLKAQMQEQGYKTVELKLGALESNMLALVVAAPFILVTIVPYALLHGNPLMQNYNAGVYLIALLAGIVIHELIHGLTWSFFTKDGWKSVEFGVIWQYLTPYCTCSEPMKKAPMLLAAAMPTVVLGFLPAVLGIALGSALSLLFGVVMIAGGGGDMLIILNILKYRTEAKEVLFLDHPYEIGTFVFEK